MHQNAYNPQITITVFDNHFSTIGNTHDLSWSDLYSWLIYWASIASERDVMHLIKLATFEHNYRSNKTLQLVYGIEGDYDAGNVTVLQAIDLLRLAGIEAIIYTTSRHTEEKPRFRILCPLSKPITGQERSNFVANLNGALGGILAKESFALSQSFYVGSVTGGHPMQCYQVKGKPIDLVKGLASIGPKEKDYTSINEHRTNNRTNNGKTALNYEMALNALYYVHPGDGDRYWWLKISGAFFTSTRGLIDEQTALDDWQRWNLAYGENNNPRENLATWRDFQRNGTDGDFMDLAKMSNNPAAQVYALFGDTKFIALEPYVDKKGAEFYFTRADQFKFEKLKWLVEKIIPESSLCLFFGASGSAKTFGALSLGMSIAAGVNWYDHNVTQGDVVYICGEGRSGIAMRLEAWKAHYGQNTKEAPFYISSGSADFSDHTSVQSVKHAIEQLNIKPCLIIIDTLSRNMTGDENDSQQMALFVKAIDKLKDEYGASVLLVHHTGHTEKDRARGSSVLKAAVDSEFRFERNNKQVKFKCTKMKDADEPKSITFELKTVVIPTNGTLEMGAVLVQTGNIVPIYLAPQDQKALDILKTYQEGIPRGDFLLKLVNDGVINADPKNHERILKRIIENLSDANLLREAVDSKLEWTKRTG